jgi:hypothetical protein
MNQMSQVPLFFEDVYQALSHVVMVLGGAKKVGPMLRGSGVSGDTAAKWVLECLNPDRPAEFHPHQVIALFRLAAQAGDHTAMTWYAGEIGYQATPVAPEDVMAELQRQFIASTQAQKLMIERMEALAAGTLELRARAERRRG